MSNAEYGYVPYWDHLGIKIQHAENGCAEAYIDVAGYHLQSAGNVHGGVIVSLIDSCIAAAFRSITTPAEGCSTIDLSTRFLRPISEGRVICRARIVHSGLRVFFAEASVHSNGQLAAMAQATFRRFKRQASASAISGNGGDQS